MKINILGTEWELVERSESDDANLVNCDGYCDWTKRTMVIEREMNGSLGDMEKYVKKVKRHEIVHAFLFESGLGDCTHNSENGWAKNEEMVDWLATQGLKIYEAWKKAGAI